VAKLQFQQLLPTVRVDVVFHVISLKPNPLARA